MVFSTTGKYENQTARPSVCAVTMVAVAGPTPSIGDSVRKTNRVIVAYEDSLSWGYGSEIAARIADDHFAWLDAPVKRVASTDTFVAYAPELEDVILPQVESIRAAMEGILKY